MSFSTICYTFMTQYKGKGTADTTPPFHSNHCGHSHSGPSIYFLVSFKKGQRPILRPVLARDLPVSCEGKTLVESSPLTTYACKNFWVTIRNWYAFLCVLHLTSVIYQWELNNGRNLVYVWKWKFPGLGRSCYPTPYPLCLFHKESLWTEISYSPTRS